MAEKTIWKFPLKVMGGQNLQMPKGAEILTVQAQFNEPVLWALVEPDAESENRHIEMFGTGHPVTHGVGVSRKYISTFQLEGGALVFHTFEYTGF